MATSKREYIVKTLDGEEYGPVDQDCLVRWAENARISAYCQVRNTLLARWEHAKDVVFLRDIIAVQAGPEDDDSPSFMGKVKTRALLRAVKTKRVSGLQEVKVADYESAPMLLRIVAGITDTVVLFLFTTAVYFMFSYFYVNGLDANLAFYFGLIIVYVGIVMYFAWFVCFHTRTPGQNMWGLLVVRDREEELLLGRTFLYAIGVLCLGLLTPFTMYVMPSGRALQDIISGTRVVKKRVIVKA